MPHCAAHRTLNSTHYHVDITWTQPGAMNVSLMSSHPHVTETQGECLLNTQCSNDEQPLMVPMSLQHVHMMPTWCTSKCAPYVIHHMAASMQHRLSHTSAPFRALTNTLHEWQVPLDTQQISAPHSLVLQGRQALVDSPHEAPHEGFHMGSFLIKHNI